MVNKITVQDPFRDGIEITVSGSTWQTDDDEWVAHVNFDNPGYATALPQSPTFGTRQEAEEWCRQEIADIIDRLEKTRRNLWRASATHKPVDLG